MTELRTFKCNRCGEIFYVERKRKPFHMNLTGGILREGFEEYHLCPDCETTFWYFFDHAEKFDKLAEKISDKEMGE